MQFRKIYKKGDKIGKCEFVEDAIIDKRRRAVFICDCGKIFTSNVQTVKAGGGCGCGKGYIKHGHALKNNKSTMYNTWAAMLQRCYYQSHKNYNEYGGAGIKVCDRWLGENGFENFLADMGEKPSLKHSLDRFPNKSGDYGPDNCRWATQKEQCRNLRKNVFITFNNETLCIAEMAEKYRICPGLLRSRIFVMGWPIDKAINHPVKHQRKKRISKTNKL